ncbi:hypothetical protein ACLOJK_011098 [Asimina triloba]
MILSPGRDYPSRRTRTCSSLRVFAFPSSPGAAEYKTLTLAATASAESPRGKMEGGEAENGMEQKPKKHKGKHDKPKPWDDPSIDHWRIEKFDPSWNEGGMVDVSVFEEVWPMIKRALKEYGVACDLDLVKGTMSVKTTKKTRDPYIIIKAKQLLELLARSVPAPQALKILDDEMQSDIIKIGNLIRNKMGIDISNNICLHSQCISSTLPQAGLVEYGLLILMVAAEQHFLHHVIMWPSTWPFKYLGDGFSLVLVAFLVGRPHHRSSLGRGIALERFIKRRQHLLGPNSSTLKAIEILTGCYVLVQVNGPGNTVAAMGPFKGLKQVRRIAEDCITNAQHPIYHIKTLLIKRELAKNLALADENWDRFLPKFKKKNVKQKKVKSKEKKPYTPFPPPQPPSKVRPKYMRSGCYMNSLHEAMLGQLELLSSYLERPDSLLWVPQCDIVRFDDA